jgi:hypothetical protein
MTTQQAHGSLDGFLSYSSKSKGSGNGHLGGWKKSIDEDHGEITVWMHLGFMPTPFWVHPSYAVVENKKEEKLIVVPRRWTCHEVDAIAKLQKWRLDSGESEHRPTICPECIMTNVIARMVEQKQIGFADPVFEWKGAEETVQILAGGIYGAFRKKTGLLRDYQVAMRKAGVKQPDAFKHDMRTQLKYLFAVVDDANPGNGLLIDVESEGLANKVRAAIFAEGEKVQATKKIDMRDERVRDLWDPSRKPYPFLWKYDGTQDFEKKFTVIPLVGTDMSDEIKALIVDGPLPDMPDLEPGNCYDLRAELEAHCRINLPWDEIFGPAEAAGLMSPPEESKKEVGDDREEYVPEINTQSETVGDGPIRIGPDHASWKNKAYKPGPEFKGREVHVLPPEKATNTDVDRVLALFKSVAKDVAEVVSCEHCNGEMTTFDPSCPTCGAEYDDEGVLKSRPCAHDECKTQVSIEGDGPQFICPTCGSIHEMVAGEWKATSPAPEPTASARSRRRRGTPGATFP